MKLRLFLSAPLIILCVGTICLAVQRQEQLNTLRAEQKQLLAQLASAPAEVPPSSAQPASPAAPASVPTELLQLRAEVTRLTQQKRALAGVTNENARLQAELANRKIQLSARTNSSASFLSRTNARMVGYNTPENTLQSVLWALENNDATNFFQAFDPQALEGLRPEIEKRSPEAMLQELRAKLSGVTILGRRELDDGSIELQVDSGPDLGGVESIPFHQIDGQWKLMPPH